MCPPATSPWLPGSILLALCDLAPVYFLALPLPHTNPAGLPVFLPDWTTLAEPCCFLPLHMLFHFYWKTILLAASCTLPDLPGCHCLWKALPGQRRQDEVVLAQVPIVPVLFIILWNCSSQSVSPWNWGLLEGRSCPVPQKTWQVIPSFLYRQNF